MAEIAVEIVAVFALMFTGIVVAVMWFTHLTSKAESRKELEEKRMEILDKHFDEMTSIQCPYCGTTYPPNTMKCPNCGSNIRRTQFPDPGKNFKL